MKNKNKTSGDHEKDDPHYAPESGEPRESGRSQGNIIDKFGRPAGQPRSNKGGDQDFESGRHGTK
jgi:hypothetical protein